MPIQYLFHSLLIKDVRQWSVGLRHYNIIKGFPRLWYKYHPLEVLEIRPVPRLDLNRCTSNSGTLLVLPLSAEEQEILYLYQAP